MKRRADWLYSLAFLGLLVALAIGSLPAVRTFSAAAGTTLLDGRLAQAFEKHYDRNFPLKTLGTNAWAAAEYGLFGEGRPGIVVGRAGWLFTDEEFKPAARPRQLAENWAWVRAVQAELRRRGIALVLVLLPAKARLYPEYLAGRVPAHGQRQLYAEALEMMRAHGVPGPELLPVLRQAKSRADVFLRTDTHWTPHGAEAVAQGLAGYLDRQGLWRAGAGPFATESTGAETHQGDLLSFLPLDPYFAGLLPPGEALERRTTGKPGQAEEAADAQALFGEDHSGLALVGTSYSANAKWNFAGALRQALGSDLLNFAEDGQGPLVPMLRMLQRGARDTEGLRLVLWEIPERYLLQSADLSAFDPAWLAALRDGPDPGRRRSAAAPASPAGSR